MVLRFVSRERDDASPSWVTFTFMMSGRSRADNAALAERYLEVIRRVLESTLTESRILDHTGSDGNEFSFTVAAADVPRARRLLCNLPAVANHVNLSADIG